jgi:hypothetical protein
LKAGADPAQKAVILHLVNHSQKDVTAFNISIVEKYADGSTSYLDGRPSDIHDHQMMEDMLDHRGQTGRFLSLLEIDHLSHSRTSDQLPLRTPPAIVCT